MEYNPALDGLRAIAVIIVVCLHAYVPAFGGGFLGVDIFFVLSGFLITTLLYLEFTQTNRIDLWRFYFRRFLRLAPALLCCLAIYMALAPFVWPEYDRHGFDAAATALYLSNYLRALSESPQYLSHTWSLAVEWQFYLIWPVVFLVIGRLVPRHLITILCIAWLLATLWRVFSGLELGWKLTYYRLDSRASGLIAGAIIALVLAKRPRVNITRVHVWIAFGCIGYAVYQASWGELASLGIAMPVAELATVVIIVYLYSSGNHFKPLAYSPLVYLGKISYGVYVFHYPVMVYLRDLYSWQVTLLVGSVLSIALAALSYHTIESAVLALRKRGHMPGTKVQASSSAGE